MLRHAVPLCVLDQRVVTQNQCTKPTPSQNDPGHKTRITIRYVAFQVSPPGWM
jgi:hypothetical protein